MAIVDQVLQFFKSGTSLGRTRILILSSAILISIILFIVAGLFISSPHYDNLYVKLESSDVNKISIALSEANIDFRVSDNGSSISVPYNMVGKARIHLADKGLPNSSSNSGYELFDKVNSFGLTSFMQEITRVRALEGEIARTIQDISGIASARVHIVMPDMGSFRKIGIKPTASVMIRAINPSVYKSAEAIRHLVAAAVPNLDIDDVTVLDSTGKLLGSSELERNTFGKSLSIVQAVQNEIEMNINKSLASFLGVDNFRSAVVAELNTDVQQIKETVYDPDSRVERSVHLSKDFQRSETNQPESAVTVEQNIPHIPDRKIPLPHSLENTDKKEEQSNYEINTKNIFTTHNNYKLERLSIAVVVNKGRLVEILGQSAEPGKIDSYLSDINKIVSAAAGISSKRGDTITITSMDFLNNQLLNPVVDQVSFLNILSRNFSLIVNALIVLSVIALVAFLGVYVLRRIKNMDGIKEEEAGIKPLLETPSIASTVDTGDGLSLDSDGQDIFSYRDHLKYRINSYVSNQSDQRLLHMIEINEERFAKILRKWARSEIESRYTQHISQDTVF
ncbi:flagellar M-ring protein FliF [Candidatus Liberibacter africanus]|uniref:Flagellar M-ring protein n=1 Tax=Candidatus Liberibacter africanus PTSAPSY TaxID=1277257 RepID=A0A0G3I6B1_LIBAF|nr:flagellar basal-body MS-ring/collar protein FliF [Candidatus Liberibacter africanus]AKK19993.1 flagellar MS-ring protein [Candidatus Liberibacter africanus PTSAPSY]QTP63825.1 flagellar M-ring protein FliF [Candidatus Liberibacter africanus]